MKVFILPKARKALGKLPTKTKNKIVKAIDSLQNFPDISSKQVKKLTTQPGYRLRAGDYRVLFIVDQKKDNLYIARLAHRKDVYR
jgi:mRNA interferase RelE/StbE